MPGIFKRLSKRSSHSSNKFPVSSSFSIAGSSDNSSGRSSSKHSRQNNSVSNNNNNGSDNASEVTNNSIVNNFNNNNTTASRSCLKSDQSSAGSNSSCCQASNATISNSSSVKSATIIRNTAGTSTTAAATNSANTNASNNDVNITLSVVVVVENDNNVDKSVQFNSVHVREYERIIGDNPSCSGGAPVGIGWAHSNDRVMRLDDYEASRPLRRSQHDLVLTRQDREEILIEWGATFHQIIDAIRTNVRIKNQRRRTVNNIGTYDKWEEVMEKAGRKLKRTFMLQHKHHQHNNYHSSSASGSSVSSSSPNRPQQNPALSTSSSLHNSHHQNTNNNNYTVIQHNQHEKEQSLDLVKDRFGFAASSSKDPPRLVKPGELRSSSSENNIASMNISSINNINPRFHDDSRLKPMRHKSMSDTAPIRPMSCPSPVSSFVDTNSANNDVIKQIQMEEDKNNSNNFVDNNNVVANAIVSNVVSNNENKDESNDNNVTDSNRNDNLHHQPHQSFDDFSLPGESVDSRRPTSVIHIVDYRDSNNDDDNDDMSDNLGLDPTVIVEGENDDFNGDTDTFGASYSQMTGATIISDGFEHLYRDSRFWRVDDAASTNDYPRIRRINTPLVISEDNHDNYFSAPTPILGNGFNNNMTAFGTAQPLQPLTVNTDDAMYNMNNVNMIHNDYITLDNINSNNIGNSNYNHNIGINYSQDNSDEYQQNNDIARHLRYDHNYNNGLITNQGNDTFNSNSYFAESQDSANSSDNHNTYYWEQQGFVVQPPPFSNNMVSKWE